MNGSPVVLLVLSATLWLTPVIAAQPPIVGRPLDFSGAIGGPFVVTMNIESTTVAVEEPFTLTLRIVGPGNLKELVRPPLSKLDGFKPFAVDDLDDSFSDGSPPSRTFRYRLRARSAEAKQIPPFKFVYFNPAIVPPSRGYQTTWAEGLTINLTELLDESRPSDYVLPIIIRLNRHELTQRPDDDETVVALTKARENVRYPSADLRPAQPSWPYWLTLRRYGLIALTLCVIGAFALTRWFVVRRRAWLAISVCVLLLAAIPAVGSLLECREQARNEVEPIVVVARDSILRRGNGEEYSPRITAPLPPGAEVRRLFGRHGWLQVELANGVVGWLPVDSVVQ